MTTSQSSVTLPGTLPIPSGSTYHVLTITNPGETLAQASADGLSGYYALPVTSGLAIHDDGAVTYSSSGATFTAP